ncbi:MAG: arsenate reductase ArsC [Woeseiaceae bacterium]|nr:arsenate reductase ArsC [Woeseiaceae bacterium]
MNVLFLCTGNSARSILAEVLLNELGQGRFCACSAGSRPTGRINPGALEKLTREGHSTRGLESKSWDRFAQPGAQAFDLVVRVCDRAAGESCPVFHGAPARAHWGIPDPAFVDAEEARQAAFDLAYARLRRRIEALVTLPPGLAGAALERALAEIHVAAARADIAGI